MPSLVTGIIGGIQGARAAHHAADAQRQGYQQAAGSVNQAVQNANPIISGAAGAAGAGVSNAAANAGQQVTTEAGAANQYLNPFVTNGSDASNQLHNLTSAGFAFNPSDLQNDPGYQFRLAQGSQAVQRSAAMNGTLGSGGALASLNAYGQGLAGEEYQNAFNRALATYNTNVNSLLPQVQMGLGAAGQAGANLLNAAQYAGNAGMQGAEYAGNAGMWGAGTTAQNLIDAGVYQGNTQIGAGNALAQGNIGAANSWNGMLGAIGQAGNMAFLGGFSPSGGGWSFGNTGSNFGNLMGAGRYVSARTPSAIGGGYGGGAGYVSSTAPAAGSAIEQAALGALGGIG